MPKPPYTLANIYDHPFAQDPDVMEAFTDYLKMRIKKKCPTTERGVKLLLLTLSKLTDDKEKAIAIIDRSNTKGWTDLYQLPDEDNSMPPRFAGEERN